ncbi:MAG: hypothetical protein M1836_007440 [Candelina mexicana]|nr:MAG: hypothetical protein M1836_007440 [Candelina mexicana]
MVDPFSVAGSAAGIISLGLQVCGGLITYCRAWRSHHKDIEGTVEKLTELQFTLKHVADILSVVEDVNDNAPNNLRIAQNKIRSCTKSLNKLHSILMQSETISQPAGVLDKAHNIRLRSRSFFDQEKFRGLRTSVAEININLGFATQFLLSHLEMKRFAALEDLMETDKELIEKVPERIEQAVVKRLDMYEKRLSKSHQDMLDMSSQQFQMMQHMTQDIAALQLGLLHSPGLLQSVTQEAPRMQLQRMNVRSGISSRCTCRTYYKYKSYGHLRSYGNAWDLKPARWIATLFTSTLTHHQNCSLFGELQAKHFGLRLTLNGSLLQGTVEAAMSMTRGPGGCSISPTLAFNHVVPSNAGAFKLLKFPFKFEISAAGMQKALDVRKQKLLHLYQERKASPRDINENGDTVMHLACRFFDTSMAPFQHNSKTIELYFQFLRDLYQLGVPLNCVNRIGLTPLGELVQMYTERSHYRRESRRLLTLLNLKLLDLGAEFPLFSPNTVRASIRNAAKLGWEFALCPDLAEAFGCNEISQAILAKSQSRLTNAVSRNPHLINEPNAIGQTPLHFSVTWTAGMRLLLEAGCNVNPIDDLGLTPSYYAAQLILQKPFNILGERECVLNSFQNSNPYIIPETRSILELMIYQEGAWQYFDYTGGLSRQDFEAMVDAIIGLVVKRRRMLESRARISLNAQEIKRLRLSSESVIDGNAPLAISMMRGKIDVPASLDIISTFGGTVYHIKGLNLRQAHVLWDAGFRDIDELDSMGLSPLMMYRGDLSDESLAVVEWLVEKGARLHCRQRYAFSDRLAKKGKHTVLGFNRIHGSDRVSGTTALHYLASYWAFWLFECSPLDLRIGYLSQKARRMLRIHWIMEARKYGRFSIAIAQEVLVVTQALAQLIDVEQPSLAWLRHEMIRFNTFQSLELRHTCCELEFMTGVIFEPYDDEEIVEMNEEQAELIERFETLLGEFDSKYVENGVPLSDFLGGYWKDRMAEVASEEGPINHDALQKIGVTLRKTSRTVEGLYIFPMGERRDYSLKGPTRMIGDRD